MKIWGTSGANCLIVPNSSVDNDTLQIVHEARIDLLHATYLVLQKSIIASLLSVPLLVSAEIKLLV